jgi:hypothetical protein
MDRRMPIYHDNYTACTSPWLEILDPAEEPPFAERGSQSGGRELRVLHAS